jgi:hypothetical protein
LTGSPFPPFELKVPACCGAIHSVKNSLIIHRKFAS